MLRNYFYVALFIVALLGMTALMQNNDNQWIELLSNGAIAVAISVIIIIFTFLADGNIRRNLKIKRNRG